MAGVAGCKCAPGIVGHHTGAINAAGVWHMHCTRCGHSWTHEPPPDPRDTTISALRAEVERQAREIEGLREALAGMLRCADALHMNRYGGKNLVQVTIKSMTAAADAARALAPKPQPPASPVIASGSGERTDGHERFGT